MRLKVNQNFNWVIWGNDSTESSSAKAACKIKLRVQSSFSAWLQQQQVLAVGEWYVHHHRFRALKNRKSEEKMCLSQIEAEVMAQVCAVFLSHGLFSV